MSEVQAAPATPEAAVSPAPNASNPTTSTPLSEPPKLAGKFNDLPGLEQGIREAHKVLGLPEAPAVIGKGGVVESQAEAEVYYRSLDRQIARRGQAPPATVTAPAPPAAPAVVAPAAPAEAPAVKVTPEAALKAAGLTEEQISREWNASGDLSADTYAKLEAAGASREQVLAEIARVQASVWEIGDAVAGDRGRHESLRAWAKQNITGPDAAALNALSANPKTYKQAVEFMKSRFDVAIGTEQSGTVIGGRPGAIPSSSEPSWAEVQQLLREASSGNPDAIKRLGQRVTPQVLMKHSGNA